MSNPFSDLIPQKPVANPFSDLIPKQQNAPAQTTTAAPANQFSDLVPKQRLTDDQAKQIVNQQILNQAADMTGGAPIIGAGEAGLNMLTGGLAGLGGDVLKIAGAAGNAMGLHTNLDQTANNLQQAVTYQPRTDAGQAISKGIGEVY